MLSRPENIANIVQLILDNKPTTICDIGCGYGKYGIICKECLLSEIATSGELLPNQNSIVIDAYESCSYFLENLPVGVYNKIFTTYVTSKNHPVRYDLILLIDVLEHWDRDIGIEILKNLIAYNKTILVSYPKETIFYKEHYYGEDCPRHKTQWHLNELDSLGNIVTNSNDISEIFTIVS